MPFVSGIRKKPFQSYTPIVAGKLFPDHAGYYFGILKDIKNNDKYEGHRTNDNDIVKTLNLQTYRNEGGNRITRLLLDAVILLHADRFCPERPSKADALRVVALTTQDFLTDHDIDVYLAVFDKVAFTVSEKLLGEVASYIDEHYVEEHHIRRRKLLNAERDALDESTFRKLNAPTPKEAVFEEIRQEPVMLGGIDDLVNNLDEPFSAVLLRLIDAKGFKKDSEVYNRANIDRRLFSKIRSNEHYVPSKPTVLAFAVYLKLTLSETED
jgi:hypothetical protein